MKFNWKQVICEIIRIIVAAIAGGGAATMM